MISKIASTARSLRQALSKRLPKRRTDSGLTTLEWLLIVAAVAGLAALAVVLVQNVVSETGDQIAGSSARVTSAEVQASSVVERAKNAAPTDSGYTTWAEWDNYFTRACSQVRITYSSALQEVGKSVNVAFEKPYDEDVTADITTALTAAAGDDAPAAAGDEAQAVCTIS